MGSWFSARLLTLREGLRNLYLDALSEPYCGEEVTQTKQGLLALVDVKRNSFGIYS